MTSIPRVNYDSDNWALVAQLLRTDKDMISPMGRAQVAQHTHNWGYLIAYLHCPIYLYSYLICPLTKSKFTYNQI